MSTGLELLGMSSPNVLKVMILLSELNIDYRFRHINLMGGDHFSEAFGDLNPLRKVPVLIDYGAEDDAPMTVFESGAILLHLAEQSDQFLLPRSARERTEALQWLMVEAATAGPVLGQYNHFLRFAPDNAYSVSRFRTLAGRVYDTYEARLASRAFVATAEYTIADMAMFPWVQFFYDFHAMDWREHPNLARWRERIAARPGVSRALLRYAEVVNANPDFTQPADPETIDLVLGRGKFARP